MYQKILLPVDLGEKHQQALEAASCLARLSAGDVTLLHVIEVIPGLPMEEEKAFYARLEEPPATISTDSGLLSAACHSLAVGDPLRPPRPRRDPLHPREMEADLIVLTSPRYDRERPAAGWGSLSYRIGLLSDCPVLLVK